MAKNQPSPSVELNFVSQPLHQKYRALLNERNLYIATCKKIQLPTITPITTTKNIYISQFSIPNQEVGPQPKQQIISQQKDQENFMDVLDWEVFRKTKPLLQDRQKFPKPQYLQYKEQEWVQNEAKNILQRFKLKVQSQIEAFNITQKCRYDKQNKSPNNDVEVVEERTFKFTRLPEKQVEQVEMQKQIGNHLPEMLAKIIRQKAHVKKHESETRFLSTSSQKLVRKIFEMEEREKIVVGADRNGFHR